MEIKEANDNPEKYHWRYLNKMCEHYETTKSIRLGSFFEKFQAPIIEILRATYYYATLPKQKDVVTLSKKSRSFVQNLRIKIIASFLKYYENITQRLTTAPCWALCIIDTTHLPSKGYIELVERRNAATLLPIITRVVRPGSIIHTVNGEPIMKFQRMGIMSTGKLFINIIL